MIARHLLEDLLGRALYELEECCQCRRCRGCDLQAEIRAVLEMSGEKLAAETMALAEPDKN